jgi:CRP-like cAMP-binding protein
MFKQWLTESRDGRKLAELISRKKYVPAIELLLGQYKAGAREPGLRFTLAEVLVLAGRERQAVPVLIGLADELLGQGDLHWAGTALDRVESIDPGSHDLAARRAALAGQAYRQDLVFAAIAAEAIDETKSEAHAFDTLESAPSADEAELLDLVRALADSGPKGAGSRCSTLASSLLGGRRDDELLAHGSGLRRRTFAPGDVLVAEGEHDTSLFLVRAGTLRVLVRSAQGRDYQVAELGAGDFFGEVAAVSGRPRSATVAALAAGEALEIDKPTLDRLVLDRPEAKLLLEEACVARATSAEADAVRAVAATDTRPEEALRVLESHFGDRPWSPRMRLRLAHLLAKVGNYAEVVPLLVGLADELANAGESRKAIAILKKIGRLKRRDVEEICLAPLPRRRGDEDAAVDGTADDELRAILDGPRPATAEDRFRGWLLDLVRDTAGRLGCGPRPPDGASPALGSSA